MAASTQRQAAPAPAVAYAGRARQVWSVIALSTVLFCALCAATGIGASSYLSSVTKGEHADLEKIRGAQLVVQRHLHKDSEAVENGTQLNEGDLVITGADTEANVVLFDGSTLHLYFGTKIEADRLRASRFLGSLEDIAFNLQEGTAIISTASQEVADYSSADYVVSTPDSEIKVARNSTVRVQVNPSQTTLSTQVIVTFGSVEVVSNGKRVAVSAGQMTEIPRGGLPSDAHTAAQELVRNGDFREPPTSGKETVDGGGLGTAAWQPILEASDDSSSTEPISRSIVITSESLPGQPINAARINSNATTGKYARVGLRQDINAPVSFLHYISLNATVKIVQQTEPVGGPQGDVYPLTVRVLYTTSDGKAQTWDKQFYAGMSEVPILGAWRGIPPASGTKDVAPDKYVMKQVDANTSIGQDIAVINGIEIFGIGDKFQSWITDISLIAR